MTLKPVGPLDSYNSLTDEYLVDYFNNKRIRKHLRQMGLITKRGEVVDEPTFRYTTARKEHRAHVKELMSQAVINKTLELERNRRAFIRDKLIEIRKIETVNRIKRDRDEHSPEKGIRPKSAPPKAKGEKQAGKRCKPKCVPRSAEPKKPRCVLVNNFTVEEGCSQKFGSDVTLSTASYHPPPHSNIYHSYSSPDIQQQPLMPGRNIPARPKSAMARNKRTQNHIKSRPKSANINSTQYNNGNTSTAPVPTFLQRRQIHSMSKMTLRYLGKSLDLSSGVFGDAVQVMIMQQHCGGNTVCVFQGLVSPNECFTFTSRRHRDAPFGITIYLGSMMDTRLSTCCEYKHKPGHILGGKSGHFALVRVEGCLPCYKCFAHVDEFKRQQTAAHSKFQEDVKKSSEGPKKSAKGKKKKVTRKKQGSNSSYSSSDNEDDKPSIEATVTVKPKKDSGTDEKRTATKVPNNHVIEEPDKNDIKEFEKLVVKTNDVDEVEHTIVLENSDSEEELERPKSAPPKKEEDLKLESESSSSEDEKEKVEEKETVTEIDKEVIENGYDEEEFHSDNEDDKKSDISVASSLSSVKSAASAKSEASIKSESSIKSNVSIKSEASVKSNSSIKSEASIKSERSQSSIKSASSIKSNTSVKSNSSIKSDATIKSEGSIRSEGSVRSQGSNGSKSSTRSNKSDSSKKSDRSVRSDSSRKSDRSLRSDSSRKSDRSVRSDSSKKSDRSVSSKGSSSSIKSDKDNSSLSSLKSEDSIKDKVAVESETVEKVETVEQPALETTLEDISSTPVIKSVAESPSSTPASPKSTADTAESPVAIPIVSSASEVQDSQPLVEPELKETQSVDEINQETVKEEPVKEEPVKEPVKEAPVKEEPVKEEPVKEEPVKEEPVKEEPMKEEPMKEEPAKEAPAKENSVIEEPVKEDPVKEDPVKEELVKEESVKEAPAKENSVIEEPVIEEPVKEVPVKEEPVKADKSNPAKEVNGHQEIEETLKRDDRIGIGEDPAERRQDAGLGARTERLSSELSDTIIDFLEKIHGPSSSSAEEKPTAAAGTEAAAEAKVESDNESEVSIHSAKSNTSDTTTNASVSATQLTKILSPTHSILSTESNKSKDPNRRIRFSDTMLKTSSANSEPRLTSKSSVTKSISKTRTSFSGRKIVEAVKSRFSKSRSSSSSSSRGRVSVENITEHMSQASRKNSQTAMPALDSSRSGPSRNASKKSNLGSLAESVDKTGLAFDSEDLLSNYESQATILSAPDGVSGLNSSSVVGDESLSQPLLQRGKDMKPDPDEDRTKQPADGTSLSSQSTVPASVNQNVSSHEVSPLSHQLSPKQEPSVISVIPSVVIHSASSGCTLSSIPSSSSVHNNSDKVTPTEVAVRSTENVSEAKSEAAIEISNDKQLSNGNVCSKVSDRQSNESVASAGAAKSQSPKNSDIDNMSVSLHKQSSGSVDKGVNNESKSVKPVTSTTPGVSVEMNEKQQSAKDELSGTTSGSTLASFSSSILLTDADVATNGDKSALVQSSTSNKHLSLVSETKSDLVSDSSTQPSAPNEAHSLEQNRENQSLSNALSSEKLNADRIDAPQLPKSEILTKNYNDDDTKSSGPHSKSQNSDTVLRSVSNVNQETFDDQVPQSPEKEPSVISQLFGTSSGSTLPTLLSSSDSSQEA